MELEELKEEFEDVSEELLEKALEEGEDAEDTRNLLQPDLLVLQGKFAGAEQDPGILFQICWELQEDFEVNLRGVVAGYSAVYDVSVDEVYTAFKTNILKMTESGPKLGRLTKEFNELLQTSFLEPEEEFLDLLREFDLEAIEESVLSELSKKFDFSPGEIETNFQLLRNIHTKDREEPAEETSQAVNFKCQTRVNPTRGLPLDLLQVGDNIFVEIAESPEDPQEQKILNVLRNHKDEEIGMIPAKIIAIEEERESGDLQITVKFGENVTGTLNCGSNVNILCPESTLRKKGKISNKEDGVDWEDLLFRFWPLFLLAGLLILLYVLLQL